MPVANECRPWEQGCGFGPTKAEQARSPARTSTLMTRVSKRAARRILFSTAHAGAAWPRAWQRSFLLDSSGPPQAQTEASARTPTGIASQAVRAVAG